MTTAITLITSITALLVAVGKVLADIRGWLPNKATTIKDAPK